MKKTVLYVNIKKNIRMIIDFNWEGLMSNPYNQHKYVMVHITMNKIINEYLKGYHYKKLK